MLAFCEKTWLAIPGQFLTFFQNLKQQGLIRKHLKSRREIAK